MKEAWFQYSTLTTVLLKNSLMRTRNAESGEKSKRGKVGAVVVLAITALLFVAFGAISSISLTLSAIESGMTEALMYVFIAIAQVTVFFFGSMTVLGNLFYSSDNTLLAGLPFRKGVVFTAKFTVSYIGELLFTAIILLPMLVASGITMSVNGIALSWTYYLFSVLSVLLAPAVPLLLTAIVALPLSYGVSLLKRRNLGKGIITSIFYTIAVILYYTVVSFLSGTEGAMDESTIGILNAIKKVTVFNMPLVNSLIGKNAFVSFIVYVGGVIVVTAFAVAISLFFYKKALFVSAESAEAMRSVMRGGSKIEKRSEFGALLYKEIKTLLHTPTLLLGAVMTIVLPVLIIFFYGKLWVEDVSEIEMTFGSDGVNMYTVSLITFISYLFVSTTNQVASVGFSREGKNIYMLKSLPVSIGTIINVKLAFASCITIVSAIAATVALPFATGIYNPVGIIGFFINVTVGGVMANCVGLYNDLKNPDFNWTNINEITKNNQRMVKPMLLTFGVNIVCLAIGIVLGIVGTGLGDSAILTIYYTVYLLPSLAIGSVYYYKLAQNKEKYFAAIGG